MIIGNKGFRNIVAYIELKLRNPAAADKLVEDVYAAIDETLEHPTITQPVYREPDVAQPYYVIRVRNYSIFYIVRGDVMEVRALLQIVENQFLCIAATRPNTALALCGRARPAGHPAARSAA